MEKGQRRRKRSHTLLLWPLLSLRAASCLRPNVQPGFHNSCAPTHAGYLEDDPLNSAHQNRAIAIASDVRVDGAKSPDISQKEGGFGLGNQRLSITTLNRNASLLCLVSGIASDSGVRNGHRNCKSQRALRFRCAKPLNKHWTECNSETCAWASSSPFIATPIRDATKGGVGKMSWSPSLVMLLYCKVSLSSLPELPLRCFESTVSKERLSELLCQTRWVLAQTPWVRFGSQMTGQKELTRLSPRNSVKSAQNTLQSARLR